MKITEVHARAIEDWLKSSGYSQRAAAKVLGVSNTAIHKWLTPGAGLHRTQWNKLLHHIEPFLPQSDGWESTHKLIDQISRSNNSGLKKVYIDNFLKSFTETNQSRELLGKVELSDFSDLVNSKEDVVHVVLPYKSLDKPEAFVWYDKKCSYTTYVTNDKDSSYMSPLDIGFLKNIIRKMLKVGIGTENTLFWRVNDDEDSIRIFRIDKALPNPTVPHIYPEVDKDNAALKYWDELVNEVSKEEGINLPIKKNDTSMTLHENSVERAGKVLGKRKKML